MKLHLLLISSTMALCLDNILVLSLLWANKKQISGTCLAKKTLKELLIVAATESLPNEKNT